MDDEKKAAENLLDNPSLTSRERAAGLLKNQWFLGLGERMVDDLKDANDVVDEDPQKIELVLKRLRNLVAFR